MPSNLKMFSPGKIGNLTIRNRFIRSATAEGLAKEDGTVSDKLIELFQRLAENQVGLITMGFTYVMENGMATRRQTGIYKDELVPGLKRLVKTVKDHPDTIIFPQLAHAGREIFKELAKTLDVMAPSAIRDQATQVKPREMTQEDIEICIKSFIAGARRAYEAEFDGVQLHVAHGYLLNEFISPHFNHRSDAYGGSLENRFRVIKEILQGIRDEVDKRFPITVKLNTVDFVTEPQLTIEESTVIAKRMVEEGVVAIETSGGAYESMLLGNFSPTRVNIKSKEDEAYFLPQAEIIKKEINVPVILVGGIRSKETVEEVLRVVDFVALSRPLVHEPDLITKWKDNLTSRSGCISCNRCLTEQGDQGLRCVYLEKKQKREKVS
ncbi:MAG TPA: NADH:flavin oxidoreductase [Candidatus Deferrimicrobium sp.]|nr:NADH:flavin oxidoreductase [Candidatus Deferrimicrobium sp.]